jgi:uncharacterized membrane protein YdbT with pleckstrin-like domain
VGYVEENLSPGEEIVYRAKLHRVVFVAPIVLLVFGFLFFFLPSTPDTRATVQGCSGAFLLLMMLVILGRLIAYRTSEFAVTNKRVMIKIGWIRRHSLELLLQKVEGIGVDQGIFGRWFGYGTITVTGTGGTKEPFKNIANPLEFRKQVQARVPGVG